MLPTKSPTVANHCFSVDFQISLTSHTNRYNSVNIFFLISKSSVKHTELVLTTNVFSDNTFLLDDVTAVSQLYLNRYMEMYFAKLGLYPNHIITRLCIHQCRYTPCICNLLYDRGDTIPRHQTSSGINLQVNKCSVLSLFEYIPNGKLIRWKLPCHKSLLVKNRSCKTA